MAVAVTEHTDPSEVLAIAGAHLGAEPVGANQVLIILQRRIEAPAPGRYWVGREHDRVVGVVVHAPTHMPAVLGPMTPATARELAAHLALGDAVPGVRGEAATAAAFAGTWTEARGTGAAPTEALRFYELDGFTPPPAPAGALRPAAPDDRDLLVAWTRRFHEEVSVAAPEPPEARIDPYLRAGEGLWVWDDDGPRAMAALTPPVAGVTRVGLVYTPDARRRRGYGGAVVAGVSAHARAEGHRVVLTTELANPTSNGLYRRIGYKAVAEMLVYRFA